MSSTQVAGSVQLRQVRPADLEEVLRHRSGMFHDMGFTDQATLDAVAESSRHFIQRESFLVRVTDLVVSRDRSICKRRFANVMSRNNRTASRADIVFIHQTKRVDFSFQTIEIRYKQRNNLRIKVTTGFVAQHFDRLIARQSRTKRAFFAD